MNFPFCVFAGWGVGPGSSGQGGSGWGERPTSGWDSKAPASGGGGQSSWNDGSSYRGSSNNSSNTWSNNINKDERYLRHSENTNNTIAERLLAKSWLCLTDHLHCVLLRSNTWTNAPKPQQGWDSNSGNGNERWSNGGDGHRGGGRNHWGGEPQKGTNSVGWDNDRSGSGCWSEPNRTNNTTSSSSGNNTWAGSGGSNTPDKSTPNAGSNWGDAVHKPNPQGSSQGWGEPMNKSNHGAHNWSEPISKPSNEWGKGPESTMSTGNQVPNKPTGTLTVHPIATALEDLLLLFPWLWSKKYFIYSHVFFNQAGWEAQYQQ